MADPKKKKKPAPTSVFATAGLAIKQGGTNLNTRKQLEALDAAERPAPSLKAKKKRGQGK